MSYHLAYPLAFFSEFFSRGEPLLTRYRIKLLATTRRISYDKAKTGLGYSPLFNLDSTVKDMIP